LISITETAAACLPATSGSSANCNFVESCQQNNLLVIFAQQPRSGSGN
jgi:hypothetical protein